MLSVQADVIYLLSDLHIDHPHSDHVLMREHLSCAAKENAAVIIGGDLLDAMQTRNDPRRSYSGLREEHRVDNYTDAIIASAIELLRPYSDHIVAIADGNHETAMLRNTMSHATRRVCEALGCKHMPYRGFIEWNGRVIYYAHSGGGNSAPVTIGVIDVARQRAYIEADYIWNGHTHTAYVLPFVKFDGHKRRLCWAIRTPSYMRHPLGSAWSDEKGHAPQPIGCARIQGDFVTLLVN